MRDKRLLILLFFTVLSGCLLTQEPAAPLVRVHAAKDLNCPQEEIRVDLFRRSGVAGAENWQRLPAIAADGAQVLTLQPWQLPELLSVVAIEGSAAPVNLRAVPNPFAEANAVAVPVVPEVC